MWAFFINISVGPERLMHNNNAISVIFGSGAVTDAVFYPSCIEDIPKVRHLSSLNFKFKFLLAYFIRYLYIFADVWLLLFGFIKQTLPFVPVTWVFNTVFDKTARCTWRQIRCNTVWHNIQRLCNQSHENVQFAAQKLRRILWGLQWRFTGLFGKDQESNNQRTNSQTSFMCQTANGIRTIQRPLHRSWNRFQ